MWHVGIDVGGTFTDLFAFDNRSGESRTSKVLTIQHDRAEGVYNALRAADIPAAVIDTLVHGSTTATNALVERSYPPAAMIATEGFRDVIEIGRQRRKDLFDLHQQRPEPIIPRRRRHTPVHRQGQRCPYMGRGWQRIHRLSRILGTSGLGPRPSGGC